MHVPINVKSPNNISEWQMGFNSAFKGLIWSFAHTSAFFYLLMKDAIVWPKKEVRCMMGTMALEASPFFSYCLFPSTPLWLPTGWLGGW
jgi:hypothetical protein